MKCEVGTHGVPGVSSEMGPPGVPGTSISSLPCLVLSKLAVTPVLHTSFYVCISVFLSVQCYAWTEYKFTCVCLRVCVCLSVCVSVIRSVNSRTGQTPQRIFIVDS